MLPGPVALRLAEGRQLGLGFPSRVWLGSAPSCMISLLTPSGEPPAPPFWAGRLPPLAGEDRGLRTALLDCLSLFLRSPRCGHCGSHSLPCPDSDSALAAHCFVLRMPAPLLLYLTWASTRYGDVTHLPVLRGHPRVPWRLWVCRAASLVIQPRSRHRLHRLCPHCRPTSPPPCSAPLRARRAACFFLRWRCGLRSELRRHSQSRGAEKIVQCFLERSVTRRDTRVFE